MIRSSVLRSTLGGARCGYHREGSSEQDHAASALRSSTCSDPDMKDVVVFGKHDERTLRQIHRCMEGGSATQAVLCADGHLGYGHPIGGVVAYEEHISISGCVNHENSRPETKIPCMADGSVASNNSGTRLGRQHPNLERKRSPD